MQLQLTPQFTELGAGAEVVCVDASYRVVPDRGSGDTIRGLKGGEHPPQGAQEALLRVTHILSRTEFSCGCGGGGGGGGGSCCSG